jgi:hypothetical protein
MTAYYACEMEFLGDFEPIKFVRFPEALATDSYIWDPTLLVEFELLRLAGFLEMTMPERNA